MKLMIVIAAMVGSAFLMTLADAADTEQQKSKPPMEQKQAEKDKEKKIPGGSVGEERTGGSGPGGTSGGGNVKAPQQEGVKKKP
jgi:hypothetical protein